MLRFVYKMFFFVALTYFSYNTLTGVPMSNQEYKIKTSNNKY